MELFRNTAKQAEQGLVIVTHDPNVRRFADRVVRIRDGRLS
jgi:ABC-type lipoprotein export system ATPase subunit